MTGLPVVVFRAEDPSASPATGGPSSADRSRRTSDGCAGLQAFSSACERSSGGHWVIRSPERGWPAREYICSSGDGILAETSWWPGEDRHPAYRQPRRVRYGWQRTLMRIPITRLVVTLCVLAASSTGAHARQEQPGESQQTFRTAVDVVTIQASVRDARGRPMRGLTAGDFEVRDNGQLRPMLSLRADQHPPVSLAILVDMSGSMRLGPKIAMAQQALDAVVSQLRPGTDEVGLFTFDSALQEREFFTRDLAALQGALSEFEPFGTTSLYDAAAETARSVAARSATHKAIVGPDRRHRHEQRHEPVGCVGAREQHRRAGVRGGNCVTSGSARDTRRGGPPIGIRRSAPPGRMDGRAVAVRRHVPGSDRRRIQHHR